MGKTRLNRLEAFGYEYGVILQTAGFLFISQLVYILIVSFIYSFPGSSVAWLFSMYLGACIFSVAYDLHFFSSSLPKSIPQHIRTCTDLAVFFSTGDFLLIGDQAKSSLARAIAQDFIQKNGALTCLLFFLTSLFLANCAFISGFRMIINIIVTLIIMGRAVEAYFGPPRNRDRRTSSSEGYQNPQEVLLEGVSSTESSETSEEND